MTNAGFTTNGSFDDLGPSTANRLTAFERGGGSADDFTFAVSTLVGYSATSIPVQTLFFADDDGGQIIFATSTSVTLQQGSAVTPEPSSLALLGTGLLGLVGAVRKRFA